MRRLLGFGWYGGGAADVPSNRSVANGGRARLPLSVSLGDLSRSVARACGILACAFLGGVTLADNGPVTYQPSAITAGTTLCFPTRTPQGQIVIDSNGSKFRCDAGTGRFFYADMPPCPSNPPSAVACTASTILRQCARTDNGDIWACAGSTGFMVNKSGSGGSSSGAAGLIQRSAGSGAFGSVPGFTGDSSTGAVNTKIINGMISVIGYGAVGDGTTDDTAAIQAAINAAKASNTIRRVYIPAGAYKITTSLNVTAAFGLRIEGASGFQAASQLRCQTGATPCLDLVGSTDIELDNIFLEGLTAGTPSLVGILLGRSTTSGSEHIVFKDVSVSLLSNHLANAGVGTVGVYVFGAEIGSMRDCHVMADNGIVFTRDNLYAGITSPHVTMKTDPASMSIWQIDGATKIGGGLGPALTIVDGYEIHFKGYIARLASDQLEGAVDGTPYTYAVKLASGSLALTANVTVEGSIEYYPSAALIGELLRNSSFYLRIVANSQPQFVFANMTGSSRGNTFRLDPSDGTSHRLIDISQGSWGFRGCTVYLYPAQSIYAPNASDASSNFVIDADSSDPTSRITWGSGTAIKNFLSGNVQGARALTTPGLLVGVSSSGTLGQSASATLNLSTGAVAVPSMTVSATLNGPHSTTLPATCSVADEYFDTDATAGLNEYRCTTPNVWTLEGDGGGAFLVNGGVVASPNLSTNSKIAVSNPSGGTINFTPVAGALVAADMNANAGILLTQLATFPSSTLAGRLTDETGTGPVVLGNAPAIASPVITTANNAKCARYDSSGVLGPATADCPNGGGGTVSSVGVSMPSDFAVANSPVTANGTIAVTWASQTANKVMAGPASGGAATPAFRLLAPADIPACAGTAGTFGGIPAPSAGDISSGFFLKSNCTWAAAAGLATTGTPAQYQGARFGAGGTTLNGISTWTVDDSGNMLATSYTTATPANGLRRAKFVGNTTDIAAPANTDALLYFKSASLTDGLQLPFFRNATTGVIKIFNGASGDVGDFTITSDVATLDNNVVTGAKIALGSDAIGDIMYYNGTDYVRLAMGTTGQVLNANTAAAPSWGSPTGTTNNATFAMNSIATGDTGIVHIPSASTITRIACYTVGGGTSVATVNVNKRAQATPATSGTDVTTTAYTCDTTTVNTAQTLNSAAVTAGNWLAVTYGTVTGTANLVVSVDYTTP